MTINLSNENSTFNLTEMPVFNLSDEVNYNQELHPHLVKDKTLEVLERDFQLKYPKVYAAFKDQQDRDMIEFIKIYSKNRGDSNWDL